MKAKSPDTAVIVHADLDTTQEGLAAVQEGAFSIVQSPFSIPELSFQIKRALEKRGPKGASAAASARFEAQEFLGFAGRTWTVVARSEPAFEQRYANDSARIIAVAGLGLSGVLSLLAWLLATGRERAHLSARQMTQELRSSAERYRRIVETANEGIWTVDAGGRTSFANPKLQQLLGYRESEMLGRPWSEFVADELADERAQVADGLLPPTPPELRLRRKDGGELWALLSTSRITDARGHHAGVVRASHHAASRGCVSWAWPCHGVPTAAQPLRLSAWLRVRRLAR